MSGEQEQAQVGNEEQRPPKATVAICIPCGDDMKSFFAYDLARMMSWTALNLSDVIDLKIVLAKGSLIPRQRENLIDTVLEHESITHILFLDSDMRFPKNLVPRLLNHHAPAVCANYTERGEPFRPVAFTDSSDYAVRTWTLQGRTGTERIAACGFGIVLLETQMIREKLKKPYFMVGYNSQVQPSGKHVGHMGEDIYFFLQMEQAGVPLLLDHDVSHEVAHLGEMAYMARHAEIYLDQHPEVDPRNSARPKIITLPGVGE
jgi:hypothetical protein